MSITAEELKEILLEAKPLLEGREALAFRDGGPDTFFLILDGGEGEGPRIVRLLLSLHPDLNRVHLTRERSPPKNRVATTPFSARVDQELKGKELVRVVLPEGDRTFRLAFQGEEGGALSLVAELFGRHANLLLLDDSERILELFQEFRGKRRSLVRNAIHVPLPARQRKDARQDLVRFRPDGEVRIEAAPLNEAAEAFFRGRMQEMEQEKLKEKIESALKRRIKGEEKKADALQRELVAQRGADQFKKMGDLLQAHFRQLRRGMDRIEVDDLFSPKGGKTEIPLDPSLDGAANIAGYYKRYKKMTRGLLHIQRRIEEGAGKLAGLRALWERLIAAEDSKALRGIASELGLKEEPGRPERKRGTFGPEEKVRRYLSSDGLPILVGKDGASNDRLTFRIARGNDMWLHCEGAAGSHVVIRGERDKSIPLDSLKDAGLLAVHFSKRRGAERADVHYTPRKYVRRVKGAPPGKVILERHKTLSIPSDPGRLRRILESAEGEASSREDKG